jgi:hypothetical protein
MSDLQEIAYLRRQEAELRALVSQAKLDSDIVAQMNYQSRLNLISDELDAAVQQDTHVGEVSVLFDGKPVTGTTSIDVNFAANALLGFQGIVTRLFSANLTGQLSGRGKISGADLAQLNLRSLATGSFGFVLEEQEVRQSSVIKTPIREALEEAVGLFREFSQEDDDEFLVDVDHINPRIFNELSKFFRHLEKSEATLKANFPDKSYSFDRAAIRRAFVRISDTKVNINKEHWVGTLVGLTPIKRAFEFRRQGEETVVSGKFSHQISQDYLERIERRDGITLGATFRAAIEIGTLRKPNGSISTSYTVTDLEKIDD